MANRNNIFLIKRSNVPGKIPTAGQMLLGEISLNTADAILYTSGTTANSILPIGWDRVAITGDTMTGILYVPTISATTYQNLPTDIRVTGGTYSTGTTTFTNNTGGTFNVTGFSTGNTTSLNGTSGYLPKFSGTTNIVNSIAFETTNGIGINTLVPVAPLTIQSSANTATIGSEKVINGDFGLNDLSGWTETTWYTGTTRANYSGSTGPIASIANGGIVLNNGGSSYTNSDVLTLINGVNDATITVTSVSSGRITAFTLLSAGTANSVSNSVFTTGGTGISASFTIVRLIDSTNTLSQNVSVTSTNTYQISYLVTRTGGELRVALGGVNGHRITNNGAYIQNIIANGTGNLIFTPTIDFTGSVDTISVKQITGSTVTEALLNSNGTIGVEFRSGGNGLNNTFIGINSGKNNTTGINNIGVGASSLQNSTTGGSNVGVGSSSLGNNTTGNSNIGVGASSLFNNTTGGSNVGVGTSSLQANTTGGNNIGIGVNSLQNNTTGNSNVGVGVNSLTNNTTGNNNVGVGGSSLQNNTTGTNNVSVGVNSLTNNTTGNSNVGVGGSSLGNNTTGGSNVGVGSSSLGANTTGNSNIGVGTSSLQANTTGGNNVGVGASSLQANTTGGNNVGVGASSLQNSTTGTNNIGVGASSLFNNTTGSNNVSVGASSLLNSTTGGSNVGVGSSSLQNNRTGANNVSVGHGSLQNNSSSTVATALFAGISYTIITSGTTDFTLLGAANNSGGTVFTAISAGTGTGTASANANNNTTLGFSGLLDVRAGSNNTSIGYNSGRGIISGSNNTIVGANVTGVPDLSNQIVIADGSGNQRITVNSNGLVFASGVTNTLISGDTTGKALITKEWFTANTSVFTGGTVTGGTNFTGGLTANTISATTYFNLPTDIRVTGGTPNNSTKLYTFTNNTGGTFNVNGLTDLIVTGGTYSSGTAIFTNNTGGTFNISGFSTGGEFTGGTVTGGTNFTNGLTANTISATTYFNLPTDIRVTGGTYNSGTAIFTNNTGGTFNVSGFSTGGSGGTSTFTGTTSVDFGFPLGLEESYVTTAVTNSNITLSSSILFRITSSTDHQEIEDSILDGLIIKEHSIIDGVGFTISVNALNSTWGVYNIFYKIIN